MKPTPTRKAKKERKPAHYTASFGHKRVYVYKRKTPAGNDAFMVADCSQVDDQGKPIRRFKSFTDETQAKKAADQLAERLSKLESTAMRLSETQAIEYVSADDGIKKFNISVRDACATVAGCLETLGDACDLSHIYAAVKFYKERHKTVTRKTVSDVVVELLKIKKARSASARYSADLKSRLERFANDCKKDCCNVTTADVQDWLDGLKADGESLSPQSYRNYRTVLHTLFAFAVARGYAVDNPVESVEKLKVRTGDVEIFTPVEIDRLLESARVNAPAYLPCLAIGAFAGLRSAEIERLEWADVDLTAKHIVVSADNSKTASRRIVPIAENLSAWLQQYANKQGKVWTGGHFEMYDLQQSVAAATEVKADEKKKIKALKPVKWKANGLRHSYASYRFAQTSDAGRVAGECGNSAAVIHKHYRELVKPADAVKWFGILPEQPANVVELSHANIASAATL